jgi:hypothetical protein
MGVIGDDTTCTCNNLLRCDKVLLSNYIGETMRKSYWLRVLIAIDQLGNVLILNGKEDHTISGHVGYKVYLGNRTGWLWLSKIIDTLFWFDPEHCFRSIEWDEVGK